MKKQIITINGSLGSGKSSTADLVAKELGYKRFSSGDFMRSIAVEKGITLNELSKEAENDTEVDKLIDDKVRQAGKEENLVIDSRLAFHWIPDSFKVYLDLPPEIAKDRILHNINENKLRQTSEGSTDSEEVYEKITSRLESEKKRYMSLYSVDHTDKKNFDLIIDTNKNNLEQVVKILIENYKRWLEN